ncbi:MAG: rod shape-determining protein MreD [Planctomycetota bacterium]|jgi:rod shape-determining protein MreD
MRWFRFAVLLSLVTVLQASFLADLNIKPDLLLILLVFFAIYCNTSRAIITSFTIGFAADIIGSAMGPQIISFGLFGTALAYLRRVIVIRKMPYQALAIFITALLAGLLAHFLSFLKGEPVTPNIYAVIFWTSLCSSLVGPFLFLPSAWWMRIKTDRLRR